MGRWKPGESDEYVRNQILMTDKIQKAVAPSLKTKKVICSSDELTLEHLERFCIKKGMPAADVQDMLGAIRKASAFFDPVASDGFDVVLSTPAAETPDPESDGPCDDGFGPARVSASEDSVEEQACLSHGAWVVSEARKTLHKIGSCWRRPGLHYRRFTLLDPEEVTDPKAKSLLYSRLCMDCFPRPPELETSSSEGETGNLSVSE